MDNERMSADTKAIALIAMVVLLILGMVVWGTAKENVQPNVVGGFFTIAAAMGAAFVAFYQLHRQAVNTIKANRKNEEMKLKKEIYVSAKDTCDAAVEALNVVHRMALEGRAELLEYREMHKDKRRLPAQPQFSVKNFAKKYDEAAASIVKIMNLVESWAIVEPKIRIFRQAFEVSGELKRGAFATFITGAYRYFEARAEADGTWLYESWFTEDYLARQNALSNAIFNEIAYVYDFKIAFQNALLEPLFERTIELRQPTPHRSLIIDINRPAEVSAQLAALQASATPFNSEQR